MKSASAKLIVLSSLLALATACSDAGGQGQAEGGPPAMPPSPVSFVETKAESLPITNELPGRVAPTRIAEVRPRVSGIIVERIFEQGSLVKAGDVLYRIDPAPFQVQVDSAKATLQRAEAGQVQARQTADRQRELRERRINSASQEDSAVSALAQADADVAAARASLAAAELNLQYSEVKAPIAGRIGRADITEGALVSSTDNLATIQQFDPVYVDFTQSSNALLALKRAAEAGTVENLSPTEARVRIKLDDGSEYGSQGRFLFSEAAVDQTTGQVTLRAEVPNPKSDLLPGMYVRVLIEQGIERNAITVPQQAVQRDAGGNAQVYLVGAENKAEILPIRTGRTIDERVVVTEGLKGGEKVIAEGFQKIRPGAPINPSPWNPDAPPQQGGAGQDQPENTASAK